MPTALKTGDNAGASFCVLFGTHIPFDDETLDGLYRNHGRYVSAATHVDNRNVRDGFIVRADARLNHSEASRSGIGK